MMILRQKYFLFCTKNFTTHIAIIRADNPILYTSHTSITLHSRSFHLTFNHHVFGCPLDCNGCQNIQRNISQIDLLSYCLCLRNYLNIFFRDSVSIDVWKLTVIFSIAMVLCSVRFLKNYQISNMWSLF